MQYRIVTGFLKNLAGGDHFSSFISLLLGIHEQIFLNIFANKGRTIFQAALAACFCKERLLN